MTIQVASIDTGNGPRDEQLRINEFLDAPTYPTITFISTAVEQISDRRFDVTGDLTIKATTREVTVTLRPAACAAPDADSISFKGTATHQPARLEGRVAGAARDRRRAGR